MCRPLARDFSALTGSDSSNADSRGKFQLKQKTIATICVEFTLSLFLFYLLVFRCVERGDLFCFFRARKPKPGNITEGRSFVTYIFNS